MGKHFHNQAVDGCNMQLIDWCTPHLLVRAKPITSIADTYVIYTMDGPVNNWASDNHDLTHDLKNSSASDTSTFEDNGTNDDASKLEPDVPPSKLHLLADTATEHLQQEETATKQGATAATNAQEVTELLVENFLTIEEVGTIQIPLMPFHQFIKLKLKS